MVKKSGNLQRLPSKQKFDDKKSIIYQINEIVIKYKDTKTYKFIYNHPKISVAILIIWGIAILALLFYFIYKMHHHAL
jgi:hypothetical protein